MKEEIRKAIETFAGADQSPRTTEQMLRWLGQKVNRQEKDDALYAVWQQTEAEADASTEEALRRVYARIDARRAAKAAFESRSRSLRLRIAGIAAAVLIGLTIPVALFLTGRYIRETTRMESFTTTQSPTTLTLPDGSTVRLKARSTVLYPHRFRNEERIVHLIGEGYFKVVRQPDRPFRVRAQGTEVVVKGTEFNLKAYPSQPYVEAVLVTGAIDFRTAEHHIAVRPSQKVVYNTENHDMRLSEVDLRTELTEGFHSFEKEPLRRVVAVIRRLYGCRIELDESLGEVEYTGVVDPGNTLEHTLDVVTLSTGTRFRRTDDGIRIGR